jgi:hypothetical protein
MTYTFHDLLIPSAVFRVPFIIPYIVNACVADIRFSSLHLFFGTKCHLFNRYIFNKAVRSQSKQTWTEALRVGRKACEDIFKYQPNLSRDMMEDSELQATPKKSSANMSSPSKSSKRPSSCDRFVYKSLNRSLTLSLKIYFSKCRRLVNGIQVSYA